MKEFAKVLKNDNNKSLVRIERVSACSKCNKQCLLGEQSHEIEEMEVLVDDPIGVKPGETVILEMDTKPILFASMVVYLVPIISLILGYFAGIYVFSGFIVNEEVAGILGSLISFPLSFLILRFFDLKASSNNRYHPKITEIVNGDTFNFNEQCEV